MKILADENVDAAIVIWLRRQGHDVVAACEVMRRSEDSAILARANAEGRIVLTKDTDFGEMVFHARRSAPGIILLRFESLGAHTRLALVKEHWPDIARHAAGHFVVVTQDRLRIRRLAKTAT
jgi:predicted nuclease of predicted toxin-antitoxin system